jgi:hypothetical protein
VGYRFIQKNKLIRRNWSCCLPRFERDASEREWQCHYDTPSYSERNRTCKASGQPVPQAVEVIVGFISNIDFISPDNDLTELYENQLRGVVQALQNADPEKLSRTQMRPIVNGISALNTRIERVKEIIETAKVFFTQENLSQLIIQLEDNKNISSSDVKRYRVLLRVSKKKTRFWRVYVLFCCSVRFTVPSLTQFKHFLAHSAT